MGILPEEQDGQSVGNRAALSLTPYCLLLSLRHIAPSLWTWKGPGHFSTFTEGVHLIDQEIQEPSSPQAQELQFL